jgi:hypothetical protein
LLPEDGIVLPKHVGAIVKNKIKKYRTQCILLIILYISDYKLIEAYENRAFQIPRRECGSFIAFYVH